MFYIFSKHFIRRMQKILESSNQFALHVLAQSQVTWKLTSKFLIKQKIIIWLNFIRIYFRVLSLFILHDKPLMEQINSSNCHQETNIYYLLRFALIFAFSGLFFCHCHTFYPWRVGGASALRLQSCVRVFSIRLPFLPRLPRRGQPHSLARCCRPHSLQLWAITRSGCEHESTSNCSATAHLFHEV